MRSKVERETHQMVLTDRLPSQQTAVVVFPDGRFAKRRDHTQSLRPAAAPAHSRTVLLYHGLGARLRVAALIASAATAAAGFADVGLLTCGVSDEESEVRDAPSTDCRTKSNT